MCFLQIHELEKFMVIVNIPLQRSYSFLKPVGSMNTPASTKDPYH